MIKYIVKVHPNRSKEWYLNGKRHREDGPAIEWDDGSKEWYLNGKRHRVNEPAIVRSDGSKSWYLYGEYLSEGEFNLVTSPLSRTKALIYMNSSDLLRSLQGRFTYDRL